MTTARQRKAARAAEGVPPPPVGFVDWFAATYGARPTEKSRVELVDAQNLAHRALNKARAALAAFDAWEAARGAALAGWKAARP